MAALSVICIVLFIACCLLFCSANYWCRRASHWRIVAERYERDYRFVCMIKAEDD